MGFWRTKELTFIMCNRCNLDCVYCYPGDYKYGNREMSLPFARCGIIDFLVKERLGPLDKVRYFGIGEPTVAFELIKQIHALVHDEVEQKRGKTVRSEIQTNGVFSEQVARWIGEHLDVVCISCDGPPEIHDVQRPTLTGAATSEIIERNIRILREYDIAVGIRPTITHHTVSAEAQMRVVDYAERLAVDYVYFHPMIPCQGPAIRHTDGSPYAIDTLEFARNYVVAWRYARKRGVFLGNHLTINFDEPVHVHCRACLPSPQLTLDGYVSCCDEALYGDPELGERFEKLIIGKYDRDADEIEMYWERIAEIRERRDVRNMETCRDCEVATNCGGGCLGEAMFSRNDPFLKLSDEYCRAVKYLAEHLPRNDGLFPFTHP